MLAEAFAIVGAALAVIGAYGVTAYTVTQRTRELAILLLIGSVLSARAQPASIEVQKLRPNLFLLTGGNANTVVFVRSKDVVVIDTKGPKPGWGRAVADQVKELTTLPITTIINTTGAGDHVGGNPSFANSKIEIIAHEHAAADMLKMALLFTKRTGGGLPTRTFTDRLTVGSGATDGLFTPPRG